jgi:DNA invertase Pin-like site-specific DNA recombinase
MSKQIPYSDAARSGLSLKRRAGLIQLLKDVVGGNSTFRAVLVYDVSRWGRFQDVDEAAHYEYLCKSSGVPVHYCAETFANDGSMSGLIMKALKRTMAGEYSRELSVKIRAGLVRLATLGFKMGGTPPYGLRRRLLDVSGRPKQILNFGEHKNLTTERVTFVAGPANETSVVRRIFDEFANRRRTLRQIAEGLNRDLIPYVKRVNWNASTVTRILRHPAYAGIQVWGRSKQFLGGPVKRCPREEWIVCPNAFEPIIGTDLYAKAQSIFADFTHNLSEEEMLARLTPVLERHGRLTARIIDESPHCPGARAYVTRFGGMLATYARLSYEKPEYTKKLAARQRLMFIRRDLVDRVLHQCQPHFQLVRKNRRFRMLLRYRKTGLLIALTVATRQHSCEAGDYWHVERPKAERNRVMILALMNEENTVISKLLLLHRLDFPGRSVRLREGSKWLDCGLSIDDVSFLPNMLEQIRKPI